MSLKEGQTNMPKRRKKKRGQRGQWNKRQTPEEQRERKEVAFAAIRKLYAEVLPLWRSCRRGYCRRHKMCGGADALPCLTRTWPLLSKNLQTQAWWAVVAGGPRRIRPATQFEQHSRNYPPTNFVYPGGQ
jgi:hypothetical protein